MDVRPKYVSQLLFFIPKSVFLSGLSLGGPTVSAYVDNISDLG